MVFCSYWTSTKYTGCTKPLKNSKKLIKKLVQKLSGTRNKLTLSMSVRNLERIKRTLQRAAQVEVNEYGMNIERSFNELGALAYELYLNDQLAHEALVPRADSITSLINGIESKKESILDIGERYDAEILALKNVFKASKTERLAIGAGTQAQETGVCGNCNTPYADASQKFCANCGHPLHSDTLALD